MILSGTLLTPTGLPYKNSYVRLVAKITSQQVLQGTLSGFRTDQDGVYSVDCPLGDYSVVVNTSDGTKNIGTIVIDANTTETNINALLILGQTSGSNPILQEIRTAVVEANTAATTATTQAADAFTSAEAAQTAATGSATSATSSQASAVASASSSTTAATKATESANSALAAATSNTNAGIALTAAQLAESNASASALAAANSAAQSNQYDLFTWAFTQAFQVVTATRDSNGAIVTASIVWPDGVSGVFTTDVASTAFPGAIDAWHATHVGTTTKTITQPTVTRDSNGAVVAQPAITIV